MSDSHPVRTVDSDSVYPMTTNPSTIRRRMEISFLAGLLLLSASCDSPKSRSESVPTVYTTLPVVEYVVRQVGGTSIETGRLLESGSSSHAYEPRPSDARSAAQAALVVYAADNLDRWVVRTTAARKIPLLGLLPDSLKYFPDGTDGVADPHFWFDPIAVRSVVQTLAPILCDLRPSECERFQSNARAAEADLLRLDDEIRSLLAPVPQQTLVMATPFFGYFVRRYDLRIAGVIGVSEVLDSGPRRIAELIRTLERSDRAVDAVVCEAGESKVAAEKLAEMLGARLVSIDAAGGSPGRETYRDLILYNVRQLLPENV